MPGGFLLDPAAIEARLELPPRFAWQVPLAYHPRFGLVLGAGSASAALQSVDPVEHAFSLGPPAYGAGQQIARSWPELLDRLWLFEDVQHMAYALWIHVGSPAPPAARWRALGHLLAGRRR